MCLRFFAKNNTAHPIQNKIIRYSDFCHNLHCTYFQTYITGPRQSVVPEIEIFDEAYMWILFCIAGTTDFGIIMLLLQEWTCSLLKSCSCLIILHQGILKDGDYLHKPMSSKLKRLAKRDWVHQAYVKDEVKMDEEDNWWFPRADNWLMCTGDFALGLKPAATTMYLAHDDLVTRGACSQYQFANKETECSCLCCLELRARQGRRGAGNKSKAIMLVRAQV